MSENRLEDLKRASKPALDHVELVELARTQSPSQARKLARSASWPNRQADACRSLAVLRREFGTEVFETFVATTGRARTADAVTEYVRDNRSNPMQDRILSSLSRITDPVARLRLTVKHGLKAEAKSIFTELVTDYRSFFWSDRVEGTDILFDTLVDVERPGMVSYDNKEQVERKHKHLNRILLAFADPSDGTVKSVADFEGARSYLDLNNEETISVVRTVLTSICSHEPSPASWRFFRPAKIIRRMYLPDDDSLAIQSELWLLQSQFRDGRLFELRETALPIPVEGHPDNEADELDPIVDRFIELGWTMQQVRAEFLNFLRTHMENGRPQFILAVAGAKCFGFEDAERDDLVRAVYRPKLWNDLKRGNGKFLITMYSRFQRHGFRAYSRREEDKAWYRTEFVDMLANGQLSKAFQLLLILGHEIGVIYGEMESSRFESTSKYLKEIMPDAFWKAYSSGNYGVAAALAQQFGDDVCYNEEPIRNEVMEMADAKREALDEQYAEVSELWHNGEGDDELYESGRGKEWRDATEAIDREQAETLARLIAERKEQIKGVVQVAFDLGQPIKFKDSLAYYTAPSWPKFS